MERMGQLTGNTGAVGLQGKAPGQGSMMSHEQTNALSKQSHETERSKTAKIREARW